MSSRLAHSSPSPKKSVKARKEELKVLELPIDRLVSSPHQPATRPSPEAIAAVRAAIELSGPAAAAIFRDDAACLFENRYAALSEEAAELANLVASIEAHGVQEPVHVRPRPDGTWALTSGHRRVAAARLAGLTCVPALTKDEDRPAGAAQMVWESNHLRVDFTAWERAVCVAAVRDEAHRRAKEEGRAAPSQRLLAEMLSIPPSTLCEHLKIADRLLPVAHAEDVERLQRMPGSHLLRMAEEPSLLRAPSGPSSAEPRSAQSAKTPRERQASLRRDKPWVRLAMPVQSLDVDQAVALRTELASLIEKVNVHLDEIQARVQ